MISVFPPISINILEGQEPNLWMTILLVGSLGITCQSPLQNQSIFLGQGIMIGEVTDSSAIFQTRLTKTDTLAEGDIPGTPGWIRFRWGWDEDFSTQSETSPWNLVDIGTDFILKKKIEGLPKNSTVYYQAEYGVDTTSLQKSAVGKFKTLPGSDQTAPISFVVVTGMNYYFHFYGHYDSTSQYRGVDKKRGYPALASILNLAPDYFIGTGDNVYFDHPAYKNFSRAQERGNHPLPGIFGGREVINEAGMRQKYHVQFAQPRFRELFQSVATYWEKDDHDYRVNDSDPFTDFPISHELGIKNFREQLPVTNPDDISAKTYRTIRFSRDLQVWFLEGRDYRSANESPDGPDKSIWGMEQKSWLMQTLLESDAHFKCIISPTPMVGPDDASKRDNHVNHKGFRYEGDAFFAWLQENQFSPNQLFFICGDRHWQYHAEHPSGYQEFSTGALVDANSRAGRVAGDPNSTDPEGKIKQYYVQGTKPEATGGFLHVSIDHRDELPKLNFSFYDDEGVLLYAVEK